MINLFLFVGVFSVVTLLVAFAAAFVLLLLQKWGVIEYVQVHGNDSFSEMFRCNFCLSWWTGCFFAVLFAIMLGDGYFLLIPVFSTALTRKML